MYCIWLAMHKDYTRKDRIGKGSYADVYIWERNSDKMQFAIKTINKKKIMSSKKHANYNFLLNEIDIMWDCNFNGIIKLYYIYEDEYAVHLVLEYL